jgi:hypothetical protein
VISACGRSRSQRWSGKLGSVPHKVVFEGPDGSFGCIAGMHVGRG